jgi:hypothetical protein
VNPRNSVRLVRERVIVGLRGARQVFEPQSPAAKAQWVECCHAIANALYPLLPPQLTFANKRRNAERRAFLRGCGVIP